MSDDYSLAGMKVLVPRGVKHAAPFSNLVKKYGGIPVEIPLISFRPVLDSQIINRLQDQLPFCDWIIFTSNVTVETFFSYPIDGRLLTNKKIAAIGEKTEEALKKIGVAVDFKPKQYVAEAFVEEFSSKIGVGSHVLIPKGNLAREHISCSLEERGAKVDEIVIYETFFPQTSRAALVNALTERQLDILCFTSPSTVNHFMKIVVEMNLLPFIKDCWVTCIGPVTLKRAETLGLQVDSMPATYTIEHMLLSVMKKIGKKDKK